MKIGINATYAVSERPTGIGNYIINLIHALLKVDNKNQYYLFYRNRIKKFQFLHFETPSIRFNPYFFKDKQNIEIFHDPSSKYIRMGKSRSIITVHDIVVARSEDYTSEKFKRSQMPKLKRSLDKADHIITVSEFTKRELLKYFNLQEEKISSVHHGVNSNIFMPGSKNPDFVKKQKIPKKYLFFVGNIEKRKNLIGIIKSFEVIRRKEKDLFLILAGKNGYGGEEIRTFIAKSPAKKNIIELNYIPNNELPLFYQNAEALFFPSYYEGFGIPILEAMACGCPVITSSVSAMKEAAGKAALYVDPFDLKDIIEKTCRLLQNPNLKKELSIKGLSHIKNFTWEKAAENTLNVYKQCL
ncbi:MAG: glycosyltransferase family 4 protein [Spirochaetes bacterium]|nr:glycosyltransferase family 4 protein [Spirochaetota bacterium]